MLSTQSITERREILLEQSSSSLWTSAKRITEIALYVLGAALVVGGGILLLNPTLLGETMLSLPVSLTSLVFGIATFLKAPEIYNYADKEQRDGLRSEVKNLLEVLSTEEQAYLRTRRAVPYDFRLEAKNIFRTLIDRHGYENMFRYGIPHPRDLQEAWHLMARYMTLDELIAFTEEFRGAYEKVRQKYGVDGVYHYEIPPPRLYRGSPLHHTFCADICEKTDPDELLRLAAITPSQHRRLQELKQEYLEAKTIFEDATASERVTYDRLTLSYKKEREKALRSIDTRLREHPGKEELRKIRHEEIQALQSLEKSIRTSNEYRVAIARLQSMEKELLGNPARERDLAAERRHFAATLQAIRVRFEPSRVRIRENFARHRSPLVESLQRAQEEHRVATEKMLEKHARDIEPCRREFAMAAGQALRDFEEKKADLDRRYRIFFPS